MNSRKVTIYFAGDGSQLKATLGELGAATDASKNKIESAGSSIKAFGSGMKSVGTSLLSATAPLIAFGGAAVKSYDTYQTSITKVGALTGASARQVNAWSNGVMGLSKQTAVSANDLANGLYYVASAGIPANKVMSVLTMSAKASAAGLGDVGTVADAVTSAMNAYGPASLSAAQATDVMTKAVNLGKMAPADLAQSIGSVLPLAAQFGVSFSQVAGTAAALSREGGNVAQTMTGLRFLLSSLHDPTSAANKDLAGIGVTSQQLQQMLADPNVGLYGTLQFLRKGFDQAFGTSEGSTMFDKVMGGARGLRVALADAGTQSAQTASILNATANSAGAVNKAFAITAKSEPFKGRQAINAAKLDMIQLGKALLPIVDDILPKVVHIVSSAVNWFSHLSKNTKDLIVYVVLGTAALGAILIPLGSMISVIGRLVELVGGLIDLLPELDVLLNAIPGVVIFTLIGVAILLVVTHLHLVMQVIKNVGKAFASVGKSIGDAFMGAVHAVVSAFGWVKQELGKFFNWLLHDTPWGAMIQVFTGHFSVGGLLKGATFGLLASGGPVVAHARGATFGLLASGGPVVAHAKGATFGLLASGGPVVAHAKGATFGLLASGGPVVAHARYYDAGGFVGSGPVGTDTVPGYLTPGEYVLNQATTSRVGIPFLNSLQAGGSPGSNANFTITPSNVSLTIDARVFARAMIQWQLEQNARGTGTVGGAMMTGTKTAY